MAASTSSSTADALLSTTSRQECGRSSPASVLRKPPAPIYIYLYNIVVYRTLCGIPSNLGLLLNEPCELLDVQEHILHACIDQSIHVKVSKEHSIDLTQHAGRTSALLIFFFACSAAFSYVVSGLFRPAA